jgi:hypothetical protein
MKTQSKLLLNGQVTEIGEVITGETWSKSHIVVKFDEQFPKEAMFAVWNNTLEQLSRIQENDIVNIYFNVQSRKHEGKWYTENTAWKIEIDFNAMRAAK